MAETLTAGHPAVSMAGRPKIMKQSITLTQDEIEYLAELLDYEIADPEPRMEFLLEAIEIKKLRDRLRKKSIDNPDTLEKLFQSA